MKKYEEMLEKQRLTHEATIALLKKQIEESHKV